MASARPVSFVFKAFFAFSLLKLAGFGRFFGVFFCHYENFGSLGELMNIVFAVRIAQREQPS